MISPRYTVGSLERILRPAKPPKRPTEFVHASDLADSAHLRDVNMLEIFWRYVDDFDQDLGTMQSTVAAIYLHNTILADSSKPTLAIYTDGSLLPQGSHSPNGKANGTGGQKNGEASVTSTPKKKDKFESNQNIHRDIGAAAVIPDLCEIRLSGLQEGLVNPRLKDKLGANLAELFALVLGLEGAVDAVSPLVRPERKEQKYRRVAIFTDCSDVRSCFTRGIVDNEPFLRKLVRRSAWALTRLDQMNIELEVYWLPKRYTITSNRLAHDAAQRAARKQLNFTVLNTSTWQRLILERSLDEARHAGYTSDVG